MGSPELLSWNDFKYNAWNDCKYIKISLTAERQAISRLKLHRNDTTIDQQAREESVVVILSGFFVAERYA